MREPGRGVLALLLLLVVSGTGCAAIDGDEDGAGGAGGKADGLGPGSDGFLAVTASSVAALEGDVAGVEPAVDEMFEGDPLAPRDYLKPMSALGHYGPIGPWGPLALLGPIGSGAWSPDAYISGDSALAWHDWAELMAESGGPLGADGPLGAAGPLGPDGQETLRSLGDFGPQLAAGGLFAVLGPLGPLGPLGALGPLGPVGAHGFVRDGDGNYVDDAGEVVRTIDVPWSGSEERTWELFERYPEETALAMEDNDTSFMVEGELWIDRSDDYPFTSAETQFVTVLVVPESAVLFFPQAMSVLFAASAIGYDTPALAPTWKRLTDDFDLEIAAADGGEVVASSDELAFGDWIQLRVPAGARLTARVTMRSSWSVENFVFSPLSGRYRLFVVGSTGHFATATAGGPHVLR